MEKGDSHYALIRASDFTNERVQYVERFFTNFYIRCLFRNASPVHIDKNDEDEVVEIDDEDNEQQQVLVNGDDNDATLFMCPACEACYEAENECEQHILEVHADEFADDDCDEDEAHSFAEHDTEALEESDTMLEEEEEVDNDADKYEQDDGSDATNDDDYLSEEDEKSFVHQQEKNTSKRHGDAQQQPPNSERKKAKTSEQDEDEIDVC